MRCGWAKRTSSPIAGPGKAHAPVLPMINGPNRPTCSGRSAPNAEPALPSCCRPATPKLCSFTSKRSQPTGRSRYSPPGSSRVAWRQGPQGSKQHFALAASAARTRTQRPRKFWQFMRQNWLSNRIFKSFDDIVDHCCYAWNTLIDHPWKIMSIARRDWAAVGHSN